MRMDVFNFYDVQAGLVDRTAFDAFLKPLRKSEWVVYAKEPFGGPEAVLAYLSRYIHCVAISNRLVVAADRHHVSIRYKDYRAGHAHCWNTMTLEPHEFIRRFMIHILPKGLHRIRHYGLFANAIGPPKRTGQSC